MQGPIISTKKLFHSNFPILLGFKLPTILLDVLHMTDLFHWPHGIGWYNMGIPYYIVLSQ